MKGRPLDLVRVRGDIAPDATSVVAIPRSAVNRPADRVDTSGQDNQELTMSGPDRPTDARWRPRPLLAFVLRIASVLVPAAAGAASAYAFVAAIPNPGWPGVVPWSLGLVVSSTVATAIVDYTPCSRRDVQEVVQVDPQVALHPE